VEGLQALNGYTLTPGRKWGKGEWDGGLCLASYVGKQKEKVAPVVLTEGGVSE